jgi:hypothetical protein
MVRKKFTTMEEDIIKKLKKLTVDNNIDAGRMIEKLVEDELKNVGLAKGGLTPFLVRSP